MDPESGVSNPRIHFMSVLFPPPFGPMMPINSPDCMVSVMCSSMGTVPYEKDTSTSDMHGELTVGIQTRA